MDQKYGGKIFVIKSKKFIANFVNSTVVFHIKLQLFLLEVNVVEYLLL